MFRNDNVTGRLSFGRIYVRDAGLASDECVFGVCVLCVHRASKIVSAGNKITNLPMFYEVPPGRRPGGDGTRNN